MIDWVKFLKVKVESEEDVPGAIRQLCESMSNNMLLRILEKSRQRHHDELIPYLEEEKNKRRLKE